MPATYLEDEKAQIVQIVFDAVERGETISSGIKTYIELSGTKRSEKAIYWMLSNKIRKEPKYSDYFRRGRKNTVVNAVDEISPVPLSVITPQAISDWERVPLTYGQLLQFLNKQVEIIDPHADSLEKKVCALESEIKTLREQVESLRGRNNILSEKIAKLEKDNETMVRAYVIAREFVEDISKDSKKAESLYDIRNRIHQVSSL